MPQMFGHDGAALLWPRPPWTRNMPNVACLEEGIYHLDNDQTVAHALGTGMLLGQQLPQAASAPVRAMVWHGAWDWEWPIQCVYN